MSKKFSSLLLALAVALLSAACAESDASIVNKVRTKITSDRDLGASHIEVASAGHVVTLTGTVESEASRAKALKLARETEGVRDVTDQLTVVAGAVAVVSTTPEAETASSTTPAANDAIVNAVKARLAADKKIAADQIQVEAQGDIVILTGTVHSAEEKHQALKVALETAGVQRVEDRLTIS